MVNWTEIFDSKMCCALKKKGTQAGKIKIELCIVSFGKYSYGHFKTKIGSLAQFLTEILQILLL